MDPTPAPEQPRVSLLALASVFFRIGLTSFGGSSAAMLYRELVEKHRWLDETGFVTAMTLAQVLPGANPVNLSIYVGSQMRGGIGGLAAAIGLVGPPFCVILVLGLLYAQFGTLGVVHAMLGGLAAAGVGMTLSIGAKLARGMNRPLPITIALALFVVIGVLHWPTVPVVIAVTPLSIALARFGGRKGSP